MNFDNEISRYGTKSVKYDFKAQRKKPEDIFPLWVADMDFQCSEEILGDLHKRVDHGIFGYSDCDDEYFEAVKNWYITHFDIEMKKEWLVTTPGVVFALAMAVRAFTQENDCVLITNPVYYPFSQVIRDNNRKIVSSDLVYKDGRYEINFSDFENKIKENNIKLFIISSPHNPVGRVWTKEELGKIIEICKANGVKIVADEIHSDFVWNDNHTCMLKFEEYRENIVLCTAPSKTFNLAGLQVSNIFIPGAETKAKFEKEITATGYCSINTMGIVACQSAYEKGQPWLTELKKYVVNNINYVDSFLKENLPKVKLIYPEGTYLLWLDFNALGLPADKIDDIMVNEAKLWLDDGRMFGKPGTGFQRVNVMLPKKQLEKAMASMARAFARY